jgi:hypothetical protein
MRSVASACGLATLNWKVIPVAVTRAVTTPLFWSMAVMPQQGAGVPVPGFWAPTEIAAENIAIASTKIEVRFIQHSPSGCSEPRGTYSHF